MKRLTDVAYWEESWWKNRKPEKLRLYRDFDFETVRLLQGLGRNLRISGRDEPIRVIEVGAGGSRVLPYVGRRFGFRVFGSDFSLSGCRLLRANFALQQIEGSVVCEDVLQSSLSSEQFDLVYSSGLIEHFDDPVPVAHAHARLLRPGGVLVFIVPNLQGLQGKIWRRLAPPLWQRHRVFGPEALAACLRSLGFRSVSYGYLGSFFLHIGSDPEWSVGRGWPQWLRKAVHGSVRLGNGVVSFLFRLSPWRPHSRLLSPAIFASGSKPAVQSHARGS